AAPGRDPGIRLPGAEAAAAARASRPTIVFNPDFFVERLRHERPEVFTELVLSNLTRLIDLPGSEFSELLGEGAPKTPTGGHFFTRSLNFLKRKDKGVVFGSPLSEGSIAQIYQLIEYLSKNLQVEGLFRVPGNSVRQQMLRDLLNSGADVDLGSGGFHPNDVATLLKAFLGELPEPLLTHRQFHAHLKIAGKNTGLEIKFNMHHAPLLLLCLLFRKMDDDLELLAPVLRCPPVASKRHAGPLEPSVGGPQQQQHTEEALKELFMHVHHNMPDSAKKKKLIQQIARQTAPGTPPPGEYLQTPPGRGKKHPRSRSFGGLMKRKARGDQLTTERRLRQVSPVTMVTGKPGKENVVLQAVNSPLMPVASGRACPVAPTTSGRLAALLSKERLHPVSTDSPSVSMVCFSPPRQISV
ncbi:hypothetical protein CRUP_038144, partial [Coryphaenoides rupestris]